MIPALIIPGWALMVGLFFVGAVLIMLVVSDRFPAWLDVIVFALALVFVAEGVAISLIYAIVFLLSIIPVIPGIQVVIP